MYTGRMQDQQSVSAADHSQIVLWYSHDNVAAADSGWYRSLGLAYLSAGNPSARNIGGGAIFLTFDKPNISCVLTFRQTAATAGEHPKTDILIAADIPDKQIVQWNVGFFVPTGVSLNTTTPGVSITRAGGVKTWDPEERWYSYSEDQYALTGSLTGPKTDATALARIRPGDSSEALLGPSLGPRDVSLTKLLWNGPSLAIKDGPYISVAGPKMMRSEAISGVAYPPANFVGREEFRPGSDPTHFATQTGSSPSVTNGTAWLWRVGFDEEGPRSTQLDINMLVVDQQRQFLAGVLLGVSGGAFVGAIQTAGSEFFNRKLRQSR